MRGSMIRNVQGGVASRKDGGEATDALTGYLRPISTAARPRPASVVQNQARGAGFGEDDFAGAF
ncbi:MAG: hypothetical protein RLZZ15_2006 [Verrucomicrobiota bacterium]|jgi:hypothetical protein